jgi:uncharacterized protein YbjT (DUF2867 family)
MFTYFVAYDVAGAGVVPRKGNYEVFSPTEVTSYQQVTTWEKAIGQAIGLSPHGYDGAVVINNWILLNKTDD